MSATSTSTQPATAGAAGAAPEISPAEINASCRVPLLLMFVCAALWLLAGSVFGMIATLKFHSPGLLADCAWFTYGRVHPAATNSFLYGFAAQAGLGVMLWLLCHLGRTRLAFGPGIIIGTLVWNLGVKLGILGILYGESTGYEWLEMPRYGSAFLFGAYLLIGVGAMRTFHQRGAGQLHIAQWFLLAAAFWFPWIYSTASFLLVVRPVRGIFQAVVDWWYLHNLTVVWFGFIGLAAIFYFIPRLAKRPLHSRSLGVFTFCTLAMFGSWGGVAPGAPLPAWMPALSTVAAVLTLLPLLALVMNLHRTLAGVYSKAAGDTVSKFILFGAAVYVVASLVAILVSMPRVSEITHFTWFVPALTQYFLYGFFAMTMFGAIYHIVPQLLGAELSPRLIKAHFWLAMLGILLYALPLILGGIRQGLGLNDPSEPFLAVVLSTLPFLRASTTGDLLMALGHLVLLLNLGGLLVRLCGARAKTAWLAGTKRMEVAA